MPRLRAPVTPEIESFLTHPESQLRLAAEMTWAGWLTVGLCVAVAGLLIWRFWPRRDHLADLPRDSEGKLIPPWEREEIGCRTGKGGGNSAGADPG